MTALSIEIRRLLGVLEIEVDFDEPLATAWSAARLPADRCWSVITGAGEVELTWSAPDAVADAATIPLARDARGFSYELDVRAPDASDPVVWRVEHGDPDEREALSLSELLASLRIEEGFARHAPEELFRRALLDVDLEATRAFLDPSHPARQDPDRPLSLGFAPLHLAAMARSEPLVAMLLAAGASPDPEHRRRSHPRDRALSSRWLGQGWGASRVPMDGETPLLASVFGDPRRRGSRWPDPAVVRRLLEAGADPNHADASGRTPLVALLMSYLSELTVRESGPRVLEVVKLLLSHGASVHVDVLPLSTSIVHLAAESVAEGVLQAVLDAGGDPLRPSPGPPSGWFPHWTAFHAAASRGLPSSVRLLAERVADVDVALSTGHTPLHLAALRRAPACVEVLLAAGADPRRVAHHAGGRDGDALRATPLDLARLARSRAVPLLEAALARTT